MKNAKEGKAGNSHKKELIRSGFLFLGCFFAILLIVYIILIAATDWRVFIVRHADEEVSFIMSVFCLLAISYLYFFYIDREFLYKAGNVLLFFALIVLSCVLCWVFGGYVSIYSRPYAVFSVLCLFLIGRKHALFLNFIFELMMFALDLFVLRSPSGVGIDTFASLLIGFVSGTFTVFLAARAKARLGLLAAGVFDAVATTAVVLFIKLPSVATEGWINYVAAMGYRILGSITATAIAMTLMPLFESMFNCLTSFRLRELTSTNAPLLSRLKAEAPGTFNHSLIVAQLSESCALAIGENAELARAAAYYHDVGKLKQPDCFTENQTRYNVHDELTPELSADIIRSHAVDGYDLLVKAHLPRVIADVAREHHGTLPIKYFYDKASRLSGGDVNIQDFSYLGPTPRTKIAAIVMIADGAEAATRAINDRSPENVERTVRTIIEERMDLDQFDECDITMKELTIIKQTLVDALSGVHHHRVEYPSIRFNRDRQAVSEKTDE